jgi:hypothetical protein
MLHNTDRSWKDAQERIRSELSSLVICGALIMTMTYGGATNPVDFFPNLMYQCEHFRKDCDHTDLKTIENLRKQADTSSHGIMQDSCVAFICSFIAFGLSFDMMLSVGKATTSETMHIFTDNMYKTILIPLLCLGAGVGRLVLIVTKAFTTVYPDTPCVPICALIFFVCFGLGITWTVLGITDIEFYHKNKSGQHKAQKIHGAGGAIMSSAEIADAFKEYLESVNHDVRLVDAEEFVEWISTESLRQHPGEKHANIYTQEFARKLSGDYLAKALEEDVAKCLQAMESTNLGVKTGSKSESRVSLIQHTGTESDTQEKRVEISLPDESDSQERAATSQDTV